ncbi:MAG: hypothetical protein M3Z46_10020 [Actinomycetota bacterium]|nr:hypothetical protein [Actinomycetota bacterium]
MKWVLLLTLGGTGAVIVAICAVVLLVLHRLRRRNRITPSRPDDVPLFWLLSPQAPARLHRRLIAAARAAQLVAERHRPVGRRARRRPSPTIVVLCEQLEVHAAAVDAHLAFAARLAPGPRRQVLSTLAPGVAEIERTAVRISVMSAEISAPAVLAEDTDGITQMSGRLDALEAAHASLRELEAGAGLRSDPVLQVGPSRLDAPAARVERASP